MTTWRRFPIGTVFRKCGPTVASGYLVKVGWWKWLVQYDDPYFRDAYISTNHVRAMFDVGYLTLLRDRR